ncbi:MAG TPA: rhodanese-like domain-containing protein [Sedimenticola thiotaurini]|uniref:Rhodanese-like domain-containing protein n=1 Tax=Sedimenticola thiotaurini TaxID=1543721 RepID=A0A831W518_9GAMM|nr:rhodanese-like domain-containing protein [Sedimenticola thiotaurini]
MQQLFEFVSNHLYLFGALVLVSVLLAQNLLSGMDKSSITPQRATELINREDAVVVDVRPMNDFADGHILHSLNIPMNGFGKQLGQLEKYRNRPIIVACRSGAQSSAACKQLRKAGFDQVYNLRGGIMAWQNANLPVSRKKR